MTRKDIEKKPNWEIETANTKDKKMKTENATK